MATPNKISTEEIPPLVTNDNLFASYIPIAKNLKTGVIWALDKETGNNFGNLMSMPQ